MIADPTVRLRLLAPSIASIERWPMNQWFDAMLVYAVVLAELERLFWIVQNTSIPRLNENADLMCHYCSAGMYGESGREVCSRLVCSHRAKHCGKCDINRVRTLRIVAVFDAMKRNA